MRKLLFGILLFVLGLVSGQKLMTIAYDPEVLEENVLQQTRVVYATGCSEGIRLVTGDKEAYLPCLDLAEKTVKDQEEIYRSKIWERK